MKDGIYFVSGDGRGPHVPMTILSATHSCMRLWTVPILLKLGKNVSHSFQLNKSLFYVYFFFTGFSFGYLNSKMRCVPSDEPTHFFFFFLSEKWNNADVPKTVSWGWCRVPAHTTACLPCSQWQSPRRLLGVTVPLPWQCGQRSDPIIWGPAGPVLSWHRWVTLGLILASLWGWKSIHC